MTYPIPNLSRIWVRGRIIDLGKAATEQDKYGVGQAVTFAPSAKVLINSATQQIIASSAFRVNVSEDNGYFQILLPASDDPDVNPTNFTYAVKEPGTGRGYNIIVPISTPLLNSPGDPLHGQPVIELSDVVPAPGASSGLVQLVSGRGMESFDIVDGNFVATYTDGSTQVVGPVPEGGVGGDTPDATTSVKGKSVLLGGTAAAPTVPWSAVTGKPTIPELPELAEVATTGAYSDLSGKPAIPSTKNDVGLSNVDNTSDAGKPVSTATQTALDGVTTALAGKVGTADARLSDTRTPGDNSVTNAKVAAGAAISADKIADGTTNHVFTAADDTKLGGIAAGATVNATDAALRARSSHTGTQTSATISDFTEAVQDAVAELLGAGSNVILDYNDEENTLTVSATGSGGTGLDVEQVRDAIGVALVGVGNITVTVNDAADTITVSTTATANSTDAQLRDRALHTGTQSADTVVDGTTNKVLTAAEKTKLAGVATAATANATDALLRTRSTHTGTQAASTVTGLSTVATSGAYADLSGKPTIPSTKSDVGLGNVDNTTDAGKPVSSAQATAIAAKTRLTVNGAFAATYDIDTASVTPGDIGAQPADSDLTAFAALTPADNDVVQRKAGAWVNRTPNQVKSDLVLVKSDVGLGSVDNTTDAGKPVSTATQTALDGKAPTNRTVTAGTGLSGGGDLTANRTFTVSYGTTSTTAAVGNDGRFTQVTANTQTGTAYTLVVADAGRAVEMSNASANTLTVPPNSAVAFPVGTVLEVCQYGAGQTTVAGGAGVTVRAPDGAKLAKQYASASLRKRGTDEWILAGSVTV